MAIPAERIFRFLRRRVTVQYLILRSTRRVVSTNVNYHWPATVPLHSNRPLNQRMIGVLIDCYSVIITVHWQTPVSKPPSIEKRMLATVVQCDWLLVQSVRFCVRFCETTVVCFIKAANKKCDFFAGNKLKINRLKNKLKINLFKQTDCCLLIQIIWIYGYIWCKGKRRRKKVKMTDIEGITRASSPRFSKIKSQVLTHSSRNSNEPFRLSKDR